MSEKLLSLIYVILRRTLKVNIKCYLSADTHGMFFLFLIGILVLQFTHIDNTDLM